MKCPNCNHEWTHRVFRKLSESHKKKIAEGVVSYHKDKAAQDPSESVKEEEEEAEDGE